MRIDSKLNFAFKKKKMEWPLLIKFFMQKFLVMLDLVMLFPISKNKKKYMFFLWAIIFDCLLGQLVFP